MIKTRRQEEEEDEQVQQDVKPKKKNTCNRQFRSTDSDRNKKPNTKKKKNEKNFKVQEILPQAHELELTFTQVCRKAAAK